MYLDDGILQLHDVLPTGLCSPCGRLLLLLLLHGLLVA
jgi:hypothetical protein